MSCVEGTWKEERKVCPWQQFIYTENVFCTSCYLVLLSIGVGKHITIFFYKVIKTIVNIHWKILMKVIVNLKKILKD